jgi:hypothetical protein
MTAGPRFIQTENSDKSPTSKYPTPLEYSKISPLRQKKCPKTKKLQIYLNSYTADPMTKTYDSNPS